MNTVAKLNFCRYVAQSEGYSTDIRDPLKESKSQRHLSVTSRTEDDGDWKVLGGDRVREGRQMSGQLRAYIQMMFQNWQNIHHEGRAEFVKLCGEYAK